MINNKYYILDYPIEATDLIQVVECKSLELRINNDKTKCIAKLPIGAEPKLELINKTASTHEEILVELAKPEWTPKE